MWKYAVITYLRRALKAGILASNRNIWALQAFFRDQYERPWHPPNVVEHMSLDHFLRYAARYIRRPPIAQRRFADIEGPVVKFWTKDTQSKKTVLDELPKKAFVEALADHTPDRYQHAVRYYGLLSPRARNRTLSVMYALLGKKRSPRLPRVGWAESIMKCFGRNPLMDSRGELMKYVGRHCPTAI
jgi:Putative transposase